MTTKPKAAKAKTATEAKFDNPLNADELFDAADADGDGVVTKQEPRRATTCSPWRPGEEPWQQILEGPRRRHDRAADPSGGTLGAVCNGDAFQVSEAGQRDKSRSITILHSVNGRALPSATSAGPPISCGQCANVSRSLSQR